jgi:hypothetical protein|tara:strand:- start:579 stop:983 length:405 start_codon:yes stop_codon:yes gene_type:complete
MINNKIPFFLALILLVIILEDSQTIKKTFFLISKDYKSRMIDHHGYCGGESIGYIDYLYQKYNFKKIPKIINADVPDEYWSLFKFDKNIRNKKYNYEYLILLNYSHKKIVSKEFNINNYEVIENNKSCYLLHLR